MATDDDNGLLAELEKVNEVLGAARNRLVGASYLLSADDPASGEIAAAAEQLIEAGEMLDEFRERLGSLNPRAREWVVFLETREGIVYRNGVDDTWALSFDLAAALAEGRVLAADVEDAGTCLRFRLPSQTKVVPKSLVAALARDTYTRDLGSTAHNPGIAGNGGDAP